MNGLLSCTSKNSEPSKAPAGEGVPQVLWKYGTLTRSKNVRGSSKAESSQKTGKKTLTPQNYFITTEAGQLVWKLQSAAWFVFYLV